MKLENSPLRYSLQIIDKGTKSTAHSKKLSEFLVKSNVFVANLHICSNRRSAANEQIR